MGCPACGLAAVGNLAIPGPVWPNVSDAASQVQNSTGGPLAPYRALDLTDELGLLCGKVLADLGADVIKVEPPGGDPSRNLGPFFRDQVHPELSLTWWAWNTNKRSITLNLALPSGQELFRCLAQGADFVLESFPPGHLEQLGLGYSALRTLNPRLVMVSITPFGQTGPQANFRASDLEIMAASGCMHLIGDPQREPLRISEPQASLWAGLHAAAGALMAHYHRELTGQGQHVDVSAHATMLWATVHAPLFWDVNRELQNRAGSYLVGRSVTGTRFRTIWPCEGGYLTFTLYGGPAGRRTNRALTEWMDACGVAPEFMKAMDWDSFDVNTVSQQEVDRLEAAIGPFFLPLPKAEFLAGAVARDMLGYPVASVDDLLADPQLQARGFWQQVEHPELGVTLPYPGPFARFGAAQAQPPRPAPRIGEHNAEVYQQELAPQTADLERLKAGGWSEVGQEAHRAQELLVSQQALDGVRVVEFGAYAAGPAIGKHLADHGAEVIHVESRSRPDGFRTHYPPYKDNVPGMNRSALFAQTNNNKYGITLNLKHPRGVELARELVRRSQVVIENFTPGTMGRLGLGYQVLSADNPGLVMLSTCNQGQTGPHARHPGFGSHLSSLAGFTQLIGYPDSDPMLLYGPYIDYIAVGYGVVAVLAALDYRRRTGRGQHIDLSQYESGLQFQARLVLEYAANGRVAQRQGNRHPDAAPHDAFPCQGDDAWCAISVHDDEEWQALVRALGDPGWARDPRFATLLGRKRHEQEISAHLAAWTRQRSPRQVEATLQEAGVHAAAVNNMADLFTDPQLAHRGSWQWLVHPELGRHAYETSPWLLSETPGRIHSAAPCLGEHNRAVYTEMLGLSSAEYEQLEAEGVFD